jgi:hypothetical protein
MSVWPSDTPISAIGLSVRSYNVIHGRMGLRVVGDILQHKDADFLRHDNFGRKSLNELKDRLNNPKGFAVLQHAEEINRLRIEVEIWKARYEGVMAALDALNIRIGALDDATIDAILGEQ